MRKLNVTELQIGDKVYFGQLKEICNMYIVVVLIGIHEEEKFGYIAYIGNELDKFVEQRIRHIDSEALFFYRDDNTTSHEIDKFIEMTEAADHVKVKEKREDRQTVDEEKQQETTIKEMQDKNMSEWVKIVLLIAGVSCVVVMGIGIAVFQIF